ncbi:MAG: alanine racemase [Alphaproteobacteria bacterium]|nr:alanine racemase [Alphaproteobacteria bacterium]NCQ88967.1 alanine racemase [Alphaproteobacteria bacterium]NCT07868.1 alanine racemase [Alphaproteobacteria bacterium]
MQDSMTYSGSLTIDLKALEDNYRLLQSVAVQNCAIAGVIKANAYGLGAIQVFDRLITIGCPQFFVATLDEALALRDHHHNANIAVLGGLFTGAENTYAAHNITPVLNTPQDIQTWAAMAKSVQRKLPAFIHFDTGMNRLGLSADEAKALIDDQSILEGIDVQAIMSHFACADDHTHALTQSQADQFAAISAHFPTIKKSLANSSGLFLDKAYHYDMARPGYALYGGNPTPHLNNPMKPVAHLKTRVLQIRVCKKGESIGYGASYGFDKDTRTATVALGYADGFLRSHSSYPHKPNAKLFFEDTPCDVIGRVSMDLVTVDISHIPQLKQGDWLEVLGFNQGVDDLAETSGTIGYEILTSLGARYKRAYI